MKNPSSARVKTPEEGFTLLEIVVVLAVLATISGLSIANFSKLLDLNNVDEAKALMNGTGAECLQELRKGKAPATVDIDEGELTLSNKKLNTLGYKLETKNKNTCSNVEIVPTNENDEYRFKMGFRLDDSGKLEKFGTPPDAGGKIEALKACESWAGDKCDGSPEYKEWREYMAEIDAAEAACKAEFAEATGTNDGSLEGEFLTWDPSARSEECKSGPPKRVSNTCTTNGCRKLVFYFNGERVPDIGDAMKAFKEKKCREWQQEQIKIDNDRNTPVTNTTYCDDQEFWFCGKTSYDNAETMNSCLDKRDDQRCEADRNDAFARGESGEYISDKGKTISCSQAWYFCQLPNNKFATPNRSEWVDRCVVAPVVTPGPNPIFGNPTPAPDPPSPIFGNPTPAPPACDDEAKLFGLC